MQKAEIRNRLHRIFIGTLIWGTFHVLIMQDGRAWFAAMEETFDASLFMAALFIQAVFFMILNLDLYISIIGKRQSPLSIDKVFNVIIVTTLFMLLLHVVALFFDLPAHLGLARSLQETASLQDGLMQAAYMFSTIMILAYVTGFFIFLYQLQKVSFKPTFMDIVRILLVLGILGVVWYDQTVFIEDLSIVLVSQGAYEQSALPVVLVVSAFLYALFTLLVYRFSHYSLKAVWLALILLFLI